MQRLDLTLRLITHEKWRCTKPLDVPRLWCSNPGRVAAYQDPNSVLVAPGAGAPLRHGAHVEGILGGGGGGGAAQ